MHAKYIIVFLSVSLLLGALANISAPCPACKGKGYISYDLSGIEDLEIKGFTRELKQIVRLDCGFMYTMVVNVSVYNGGAEMAKGILCINFTPPPEEWGLGHYAICKESRSVFIEIPAGTTSSILTKTLLPPTNVDPNKAVYDVAVNFPQNPERIICPTCRGIGKENFFKVIFGLQSH